MQETKRQLIEINLSKLLELAKQTDELLIAIQAKGNYELMMQCWKTLSDDEKERFWEFIFHAVGYRIYKPTNDAT